MQQYNFNFDKVLFRASSWGSLMSEPVSKADKDAGKLGLSCQKELLKIYRKEIWDWDEDDVYTAPMEKGNLCQTDSIFMYGKVVGQLFTENSEHLTNDFFKGTPDLFLGDTIQTATQVDDMKNSFLLSWFTLSFLQPQCQFDPQQFAVQVCPFRHTFAPNSYPIPEP